jgi:hypothetical protein
VVYTITVDNSGGVADIYDLSDLPSPDTNVTILGGAVSGFATQTLVGAGPYTLATDESIGAGEQHVYTLTLNAQLSSEVLAGTAFVTTCGEGSGIPVAGEGLFNLATAAVGTNNVIITDDACGEIPPVLALLKTFVNATEADALGNFTATYVLTAWNTGGTDDTYDLFDTPLFDGEITVNGAEVSGQISNSFVGAGPYTLAIGELLAAGATHTYTVEVAATLSSAVLNGQASVSECGGTSQIPQAGEGLFNRATLIYGTNDITLVSEDCGDIAASIRLFADALCIDDAPYLAYTILPIGFSPTNATLEWITTNGVVVQVVSNQPLTGTLLWPGTVIDTNGVVIDWPGWAFTNGVWVEEDDGLRPFMLLNAIINPTNTVIEVYPPATPECSPNPPITIGDFVWDDLNADGIQDSGEPGISNVVVVLYNATNGVAGVTTTDVAGAYAFQVREGTYTVEFIAPTGYLFTVQNAGTNTAVDSNADPISGLTDPISLTAGQVDLTIDAGLFRLGSIAGSVFDDINGNGIPEAEDTNGIASVTITLLDVNSNVVTSTTTGPDGSYLFTNLLPGVYTVVETDPSGYFSTFDVDGPNDNLIGVTLESGENSVGNDFYDARYAAIGDFVWLDIDDNGIQDVGEPGLPGYRLNLFTASDVLVGVTTSDFFGVYSFTELLPGDYYLRIDLLPGSRLSPQFQGTDETVDNDFNPLNTRTPIFNLVAGQINTNIDAGIFEFQVLAQVDSVQGVVDGKSTLLVWDTESEFGTAGWHVERETTAGEWQRVSEFLPAAGSVLVGAQYTWLDETAKAGATYRYRLVEVEITGVERINGPYEITYAAARKSGRTVALSTKSFDIALKPDSLPTSLGSPMVKSMSSIPSGPFAAVKAGTVDEGIYSISREDLAGLFGIPVDHVAAEPIRIQHIGLDVPVARSEDGAVVFHAPAYESIYTDLNIFRLSRDVGRPLAVQEVAPAGGSAQIAFAETKVLEVQQIIRPDLFTEESDDLWLWSHLISGYRPDFATTFDLPGLQPNTGGEMTVRLKGASPHQHGANVSLNGTVLGSVTFLGLDAARVTMTVPPGLWMTSGNQLRVVSSPPEGVTFDSIYVDGFTFDYQRQLQALDNRLIFQSEAGPVLVSGFTDPHVELWDITDERQPVRLFGADVASSELGYTLSFQAPRSGRYIATAELAQPQVLTGWSSDDLRSSENHADYLVIYGPGLAGGAEALAQDRAAKGLLTKTVSIESVYDSFNHGIRDGRALSAFLGYTYRHWLTSPRYVVLLGDGSMDYRNVTGRGDSLIPVPPVSHRYGVYASDHRLGDITGDGQLEMAVGRIPLTDASQFPAYFAKLQAFEQGGAWRDSVLIATDDRDQGGNYIHDGHHLADLITNRDVLRADIEVLGVSGASDTLKAGLQQGQEFTLYIGHGSRLRMAEEGLLKSSDISALNNQETPGIFGALGCLMGSFGLPGQPGIGEEMITQPGGAVALFGSAAMVNHRDGSKFAEALLNSLYGDGTPRLGDAWVNAKNLDLGPAAARVVDSYQFLGDPSLAVGSPYAPRGGPTVSPQRGSYEEWVEWAFSPVWRDLGLSTHPEDDPDGDGFTNYEEYLAGTDPMDPDSDFVVVTVTPLADGTVQLTWPSVPGRVYVVERASGMNEEFVSVSGDLPANPPTSTWVDATLQGGNAFYRVAVK